MEDTNKGTFRGITMKVLWLSNVPIPEASEIMNHEPVIGVSWLVGLSVELRKKVDLHICYPVYGLDSVHKGSGQGITFWAFPRSVRNGTKYEKTTKEYFIQILNDIKPDVIHIWGTEFPQTFSMIEACQAQDYLDHTAISIQGLAKLCGDHYMAGLPFLIQHAYNLKHLLKHDNLYAQQKMFYRRGRYETMALESCKNVLGRTEWDYAYTKQINPKVRYFKHNETLRPAFYRNKWNYNSCEKHSIFMSQGGYPIKGMHFMIEALKIVKQQYTDVQFYVTGRNLLNIESIKDRLRLSAYEEYQIREIRNNGLEKNVHFLGSLNEEAMCEQYLKANVYVSASSIENESNSLSEAKIMGVPAVVSYVGGVSERIRHGVDGYLYQYDAPDMLAYYICKVFEKNNEIINISDMGITTISEIVDPQKNLETLCEIYQTLET